MDLGEAYDIGGLTSDEVLARHQKKYQADREWIQQQTEMLRQLRPTGISSTGLSNNNQQPQQQTINNNGPSGGAQMMTTTGGGLSSSSPTPRSAGARGARGGAASPSSNASGGHQRVAAQPLYGGGVTSQDGGGGGGYRAAAASSGYRVSGSALTVHTRASQWQKRRSQKLEELRQHHLEQEYAECTFRPAVSNGDTSSTGGGGSARRSRYSPEGTEGYDGGVYFSNNYNSVGDGGGGASAAISGLDDFLQRQERARQLVIEKAERFKCDGSKWKQEATQPEPFRLGVRVAGGPRIRSLAPPINPSVDPEWSLQPSSANTTGGTGSPDRSSYSNPLEHSSIPQGVFSQAISSPGASFRVR